MPNPSYMTEKARQAIVAAGKVHQARLADLRAQRPFRHVAKASNVVAIAAFRRPINPLLQPGSTA